VTSNGEATILLQIHGPRPLGTTGMVTLHTMLLDQGNIQVIPGHLHNIRMIQDHRHSILLRHRGITLRRDITLLRILSIR
jgi:hypothetical protein